MSPLSDSTNLAAGVTETNLFAHIKSMLYTTVPAFVIALILYGVIGMRYDVSSIDTTAVDAILAGISQHFNVSAGYTLISLIPLAAIVFMAVKKNKRTCSYGSCIDYSYGNCSNKPRL